MKGLTLTNKEQARVQVLNEVLKGKPESTEGRPWGQPLKKLEGAPVNLG